MAIVLIPSNAVPLFAEMAPSRTFVTEPAALAAQEMPFGLDVHEFHVLMVLACGAQAGIIFCMGDIFLGAAARQLLARWRRSDLMEYVAASQKADRAGG